MTYRSYIEHCECVVMANGGYVLGCTSGRIWILN